MINLFLGMILSFLPKRYRDRLPVSVEADLRHGAIASGLAVSLVGVAVFIFRYLSFIQYRVGDLGQRAIARGQEGLLANEVVHFGKGAMAAAEYILNPLTLLLIYFIVEGAARFLAALVAEEITGTLLLYVVAWVEDRFSQARAERALGPRVPDIIESVYSPDYDLRIFTCRRKRGWGRMMTVDWQEKFYEVIREEAGKPPHHFIYRLRKSPPGRVVRHVHRYDPEEMMHGEQRPPGFLSWLSEQAQRRLTDLRERQEPPAPDIVETFRGPDCDLRIASRRAKLGWDHLVTIEYLDRLYEIGERRSGTPA